MDGNNKQIGRDCIQLITKKLNNELTKEQYYLALYDLDKKYPMKGHWPPLSKETMRNYRELSSDKILKTFIKKNKHGNEFKTELRESIQPKNFKEAAEFYIQHSQKVDEDPETWKPFKIPLNLKIKLILDDPEEFEEKRKKVKEQAKQLGVK